MKLVRLLTIVTALLLLISVTFSNHSLDYTSDVSSLTDQVKSLSHDTAILKAQVAEAGSLTKLAQKAEEQGFVPVAKIATVASPASVALR